MILKRFDSFFKVLPVETVPSTIGGAPVAGRPLPERLELIDSEPEPASECAGRAIETAMADMVEALRKFESPRHSRFSVGWLTPAERPDAAASAGDGKPAGPAREKPVLELVFREEDSGEDVFHLPYDSELQHLISKRAIDSNYVPKYFIAADAMNSARIPASNT